MSHNISLIKAKVEKNDEFYTRMIDIEKELCYYSEYFADKTVYCNCDVYDDCLQSNFVLYFKKNYNTLKLKRLIVTGYRSGGTGYYYDSCNKTACLNGNGDFRSDECIELLKQADIVVTNPPFSLFREYVSLMMQNEKDFIVLGNMNFVSSKDIFRFMIQKRLFIGFNNGAKSFMSITNEDIKFGNVVWFTTFPVLSKKEQLPIIKYYCKDNYIHYANYSKAIDINNLKDIPVDYDGIMGVPISFFHFNYTEFDIIGYSADMEICKQLGIEQIGADICHKVKESGNKTHISPSMRYVYMIDSKNNIKFPFTRIFIKRTNNKAK